ncbi:MAG: hypothetical protein U0L45_05350 [Alistipes sp.]|nr:hypothetical protein [Alistipes sp.]
MNRKNYFAPTVEVEAFRAEQGFAVSGETALDIVINGDFTEEDVVW